MEKLPDWVQPGAKFRDTENLWHVRGIVDDGAVCRRWRAAKNRWHYEWLDPMHFDVRKDVIQQAK